VHCSSFSWLVCWDEVQLANSKAAAMHAPVAIRRCQPAFSFISASRDCAVIEEMKPLERPSNHRENY